MARNSRLRRGIEALQSRLRQPVETVSRSARIDIEGGDVDEIDPPEDLDEFWAQYKETGIVRSNINTFVSDTVEPGVRIGADDDRTVEYFMGADDGDLPEGWPDGGFLQNCAVLAGERHQPFLPFLKTTIANRWVRGTVLTELLKADRDDAESPITGFYHIRPETVYPQVLANKNILVAPDETDLDGVELTRRDEAAAYIQFDDRSIIGRRRNNGFEADDIPLSLNDVQKQVLDPDIGGDDSHEQGVFGESIMAAIGTDVEEYNATKRDRYRAIQTLAYGIWLANFQQESIEIGPNQREVVEWDGDEQDNFMSVLESLKPGDVMQADGPLELKQFDSEVPDLGETLGHYVDDITAPLPAPKYAVGFEKNINQFVTERQETRYNDLIDEERRYQERKWTDTFRMVAERHPDLDPSGLTVHIEPEADESPVRSMDDETMERLGTYTQALKDLFGPGGAPSYIDEEHLLDLVLQLPEDAIMTGEEEPMDESDPQVQQQMQELEDAVRADGGEDDHSPIPDDSNGE